VFSKNRIMLRGLSIKNIGTIKIDLPPLSALDRTSSLLVRAEHAKNFEKSEVFAQKVWTSASEYLPLVREKAALDKPLSLPTVDVFYGQPPTGYNFVQIELSLIIRSSEVKF